MANLLVIARKAGAPSVAFDIRQAALQGVVTQLHSSLEEYFNGVLADWLRELNLANATSQLIPQRSRSWFSHRPFVEEYRHYSYRADEKRFLDKAGVALYDRAYADGSLALPSNATGGKLIGNSRYPSERNIKKVLSRMGIDDTNAYLSKKLGISFDLFMQSISGTRASVTNKVAPVLAIADITSYEQKIRRLVMWLDHRIRLAIVAASSDATWRTMC